MYNICKYACYWISSCYIYLYMYIDLVVLVPAAVVSIFVHLLRKVLGYEVYLSVYTAGCVFSSIAKHAL